MGRPKAWLPFGEEVLLQRVVRVLQPVFDPIVVVAAVGQVLPELSNSIIVARDDREYLGPLNGLVAGLSVLKGKAEIAFVSSCDAPFLSAEFAVRIVERLEGNSICMPELDGIKHPLAAAYRAEVVEMARDHINNGRLRLLALTEVLPTRFLSGDDLADFDPTMNLRNVNTPEEYEAALRELPQAPAGPA